MREKIKVRKFIKKVVPDRTLIISIHDAVPYYEYEFGQVLNLFREYNITDFSILIPMHYKRKGYNLIPQKAHFISLLLGLKKELVLHGYFHEKKNGEPDEFFDEVEELAVNRFRLAIDAYHRSFRKYPDGFIPPMWRMSQTIFDLTLAYKLRYTVKGNSIYDLKNNIVYQTNAMIIGPGNIPITPYYALFEIELGGPIQVAIHPLDANRMENLRRLLTNLIDDNKYKPISYSSIINSQK